MKGSLPSDDELPTWLHTLLLVLIVLPVVGYLLWFGVVAVVTAHLDPISGPELGQFLFSSKALDGRNARIAGLSLIFMAAGFLAIAYRYSRFVAPNFIQRQLPWFLFGFSIVLSFFVVM